MQETGLRARRWLGRATAVMVAALLLPVVTANGALAEVSTIPSDTATATPSVSATTTPDAQPSSTPTTSAPDAPASSATPEPSATTLPTESPLPAGRALPRAAVAPLTCEAGQFYGQAGSGKVYSLTSSGSTINGNATLVFDFFGGGWNASGQAFNGLAIGGGGAFAYGYNRTNSQLYRWDASTGAVTSWAMSLPHVAGNETFPVASLIAGGMNPSLSNSPYYFGGWRKSGSQFRFELFSVVGTGEVTYLGWVPGPTTSDTGANGDLAFNSDGDLFLLWSDGTGHMQMVPVSAAVLAGANGGKIGDNPTTRIVDVPSGQYTGVALGVDGVAYLGNTSQNFRGYYASTATTVDPNTGTVLASGTQISGGDFSNGVGGGSSPLADLASCGDPSSLELRKSVQSRASASDQFTVSIQQGSVAVASATTQGTQTSVTAGPIIARRGTTYRLTEAMASGSANQLSAYSTTFSCVDTANGNDPIVATTTGTDFNVNVPTGRRTHIVCTFVNSAGQVSWTKTDATTGQPLANTTWRINAPGGTVLSVTDNVGASGYTGLDQDPAPGRFRVAVGLGAHSLVEVSAPAGYVVDATPRPFTISAKARTVDLGTITNPRVLGTVTWSKVSPTGGLLAGSTWRLTPTSPAGAPFDITDNTGQPGYSGRDTDPVAGQFAVRDLAWGTYSLVEIAAPVGYVINSTPNQVVIDATHTSIVLAAFTNQLGPGVKLPLTGGEGASGYWIAGMLLVAVAVGAAVTHRRYRHPHRP